MLKKIISDLSLGIELTEHRILIAEVRRKRNEFHLQKVAQAAVPAEVMEDGKINQIDTLAEVLRKTLQDAGIRSKEANLVVPSQFVVIRQLQLPDLPPKQLRRIIDF